MVDVCELAKFTASGRTLRLVMDIAAALERYKIALEGPEGVRLRKLNRIRTIRGTTAIEGNTLTEAQVTAVLAGKRVAGSRREIDEVKGAFAAYAAVEGLDPVSSKDLLKAHALMTKGLVDRPGRWRNCNVGVFDARGKAMHHAPPWDQVPLLMKDLLAWLRRSKEVPLIKSCVFHFIFETIHPFPDGNGRMGRLWQTAILGKWNPLFYAAPVENMVYSHQRQYYRALHRSQVDGDAAPFVDFMLDVILRTIKARGVPKNATGGKKSGKKSGKKTEDRILALLTRDPQLTFAGMVAALGISRSAIQKHIEHLKDAQRLRRIGPDKGGRWSVCATALRRMFVCAAVGLAATGAFAKSPKEIVRSFRAPAAEAKEAVKGFLWLEAEEFADYGGWRIDTQFVHNMGSAYLITRGVARPGGAARTKVTIPSAGTWQAWVRTRDWLPEFSPGKFALEIGGRRSGTLGASGRTGWRWERAGAFELAAGKTEVALVDLAGGYARCDAVLLVRDAAYVPPEDAERLAAERDRLRGTDATPADGGAYDVVVVGAGPGGLGASIAAARHGARTLLVHDRPVLGGNNSAEQTVSIGGSGHNSWKGTVHSREGGLVEEAQIGRRFVKDFQMSTVYRKMVDAEPCLTERANERVVAVGKENGRIAWVESVCTLSGARRRYRGTLFVDATGDGWVGIFAGAEKMAGRESFAQFREKGAPETADNLMMSGCLDDYEFHRIDRDDGFETPAWARVLPDGFDRPRINDVRAKWWLEHSAELSELDDPERARDELIRISLAYWGWLRDHPKHGTEARKMSLDEIKIHNGRREGWRLVGDVVLTVEDCRKGRIFPDAIATGGWHMDIHDPAGVTNPKGEGRWSKEILPLYTIPYRAIYSKNVPNLLMCGRGISVTHMAHGSTRLMGTVFAVGQAAGTAAALAVAEKLTPRELGKTRIGELQRQLLRDDQFILGLRYDDPANLAPQAKVTASSVRADADAKPEYVVDGELRPDTDSRKGKCTHAWQADPAAKGPQWLRLDFAKPVTVREVRLVFDSGLTGGAPEKPRPRTLGRDFVVEGFVGGAWRTLATVRDNAKRLVVQKVAARELTGLRVRVDATWGLEARIQEIMVY